MGAASAPVGLGTSILALRDVATSGGVATLSDRPTRPRRPAGPDAGRVQGTPNLQWFGSWNDWAVALLCCIIFDVFSGREVGRARG